MKSRSANYVDLYASQSKKSRQMVAENSIHLYVQIEHRGTADILHMFFVWAKLH